jgi:hypothetical protein
MFSVLRYRNQFPLQVRTLSALFLTSPSPHLDIFLKEVSAIPYNAQSFIITSRAFLQSVAAIRVDVEVHVGPTMTPPASVANLFKRINTMPIEVKMVY